ncbi:MAG: hypothetical protein ACR2L8_15770 [Solirubrobacteraceae bacterium]
MTPTTYRNDRVEVLTGVDLPALLVQFGAERGIADGSRKFPCPSLAHAQTGETNPATVRIAAEGYAVWHCHACGAKGSAVDALLAAGKVTGVAETFEQIHGGRHGFESRARPPVRPAAAHGPPPSEDP